MTFTNIGEASGAIWVVNTLEVRHPDNQEHRPPLVQIPGSANSCHGILLSYCPINGMEKLPSYEPIIADKRHGIWLTRTPTNVYLPFVGFDEGLKKFSYALGTLQISSVVTDTTQFVSGLIQHIGYIGYEPATSSRKANSMNGSP